MEGMLQFLVVLALIAGILWVISPIASIIVTGSMSKPPDLKISEFNYSMNRLPDSECAIDMCEIIGNGTLYNFGGNAKNILLTVFFNDLDGKNIGSVNLPVIGRVEYQKTMSFSVAANFSCSAAVVTASVIHSEKA
jgi:hypothetical protein